MTDEQSTVNEEEIPEDSAEAQEAEGVAEIEASTELSPEQAEAADKQTLDGLDPKERAELEEESAEYDDDEGDEDDDDDEERRRRRRRRGSMRLSKNFVLAEFHCKNGAPVPSKAVPALRRLVKQVLQPMRDQFGSCTVTSGYRPAAYNERVGGVPNSQHIYDNSPGSVAADVTFASGSVDDWANFARRRLGNIGGVGRYPRQNFVHVDNGRLSRWGS